MKIHFMFVAACAAPLLLSGCFRTQYQPWATDSSEEVPISGPLNCVSFDDSGKASRMALPFVRVPGATLYAPNGTDDKMRVAFHRLAKDDDLYAAVEALSANEPGEDVVFVRFADDGSSAAALEFSEGFLKRIAASVGVDVSSYLVKGSEENTKAFFNELAKRLPNAKPGDVSVKIYCTK